MRFVLSARRHQFQNKIDSKKSSALCRHCAQIHATYAYRNKSTQPLNFIQINIEILTMWNGTERNGTDRNWRHYLWMNENLGGKLANSKWGKWNAIFFNTKRNKFCGFILRYLWIEYINLFALHSCVLFLFPPSSSAPPSRLPCILCWDFVKYAV